jgi:hypothetical protein
MMQLTNEEREALERWSKGDSTYMGGVCNQVDTAVLLANIMLRLFPVRTYGDFVIRWDDEITPERLVASGFVEDTCNYHCGRLIFSKFWKWFYVDEQEVPNYDKPRRMLDVWKLMERIEGGQ